MKVLIISDTHGKSSCIEQIYDIVGDVDMLIHLGDVEGDEELIHDLFNCEIHMVRGNCDYNAELPIYDEFNIGAAFRNAAVVSTTYALLSRCGMQPGDYFEHEDFLNVFDFNTPQTVAALGTAISQSSELVLRQIEITIKNYEREKLAERSESHERTDLHPQRGLSDSRP